MSTQSEAHKDPEEEPQIFDEVLVHSIKENSPHTRSARSQNTKTSSKSTILAQKLLKEAEFRRRALERERALAEQDRALAEKEKAIEELELQAEQAKLEAQLSRRSSRASSVTSLRRTEDWVRDQSHLRPSSPQLKTLVTPPRSESQKHKDHNPTVSAVDFTDMLKVVGDIATATKALATTQSKPKPALHTQLPLFNGSAMEWLQFKRIFFNTNCSYSPIENISRLQSALRGAAKEAVAALLATTDDATEVMRALELRFARPEMIVHQEVLPVTVTGPKGSCDTFALLDDGSTSTVIDSTTAAVIGAEGHRDTLLVLGIGGMRRDVEVSYVSFQIQGKHAQEKYLIQNARAMDGLSLRTQTIQPQDIARFSHLTDISNEITYTDAIPTVLIGAADWNLLITHENRTGRRSEPVACRTALGWVIYGSLSNISRPISFAMDHTFCSHECNDTSNLETLIKQQYQLESLGIVKQNALTTLEQRAVDILESTARRLPTGRFEVGMTWRDDITYVPDSYYQALSRLKSLDKTIKRDKDFSSAYSAYMEGLLQKEYAKECDPSTYHISRQSSPSMPIQWYTPHFGVYHPQKKKLRVVNDAACKTYGVSLNSLLLPGPDLLQPLLGLLFRFREGRVALTADIREMFPQVRIRDEDRDSLRFLWKTPEEGASVKEYRMTSVIFGACSSPFTAQFIKNKNASEFANQYPEAVDAILHDHYMDDYVGSHDDIPTAARIASEIVRIHKAACFEMRGWVSNVNEALSLIPTDLRATQPSEVELCSSQNNIVRALGVAWFPQNDRLGFRTGLGDEPIKQFTKRILLSYLMRVYDPLGLLTPTTIKGRILFQMLWRSNVDWDTPLAQETTTKWLEWFQELNQIKNLQIPRWYLDGTDTYLRRELHLFADASELAYACVAYWRFMLPDNSAKVVLITSKARVSPLKPTSIPRLELRAALIASRISVTIRESHKHKPSKCYFWTDSMTVLHWIRSDARNFKPFVSNRLGEILENTKTDDWRWVPTNLNVADDATRTETSLSSSSRWFTGPSFLLGPSEGWPQEPPKTEVSPTLLETKKCDTVNTLHEDTPNVVIPNPLRFSDWTRLTRATGRAHQIAAFWLNIIRQKAGLNSNQHAAGTPIPTSSPPCNTSSPSPGRNVGVGLCPLTAEHLKVAERHLLLQSQRDSFPEEIKNLLESKPIPKSSRLKKLSPTLDQNKLVRNAGRIQSAAEVPEQMKNPIIIDGRHPTVRLLVKHYHKVMAHANNETVINELRQSYWLIHLRNTVRSISNECLFCRIRKSLPVVPPTGDLPTERMAHHKRPFTHTGLDYFGPVEISVLRRKEKRWVALFTCLTTRAVHLEIVNNLSMDAAISGLRRFIARRGTPNTIHSDNGTAFVGAARQMKALYGDQVNDFVANRGITWKFIPPASPNFGGCWERLVRSVKTVLMATLFERVPREDILHTLLTEAEAIINSRPLTHVSVDPEDPETLTPFHFILGESSHLIAPQLDNGDLVRRCDWKKALRIADHFWERLVKEILPTLQSRPQGMTGLEQNLKVGDLVIIADSSMPRGVWPRGRVTATYPGKDGIVRVADVLTKAGTLKRPARKIAKLKIE